MVRFKYNFDEFYYYCEQYYLTFGDLDVGMHCMAEKKSDGTVVFHKQITPELNKQCTYDLGRKFVCARESINHPEKKYPKGFFVALTPSQIEKLDALAPGWQIPGQTSFNRFYQYCKIFYDAQGNLAIPWQHLLLQDESGSYYLKDYHNISKDERPLVVYSLGEKFHGYVRLMRNGNNSMRGLTDEQIAALNELDPYWYYPRLRTGDRYDPETGKNLDICTADAIENLGAAKNKSTFNFDQFYSFALLYYTKYGSLYVHRNTVVIKRDDGTLDFVRKEQVDENKDMVVFRLGVHFYRIINPKTSNHQQEIKVTKCTKLLTDEQYQKLDSLDSNWFVTCAESLEGGRLDPVTIAWFKSLGKEPKVGRAQSKPTPRPARANKLREKSLEKSTTQESVPKGVYLDFDLFYSMCKHQKEVTGVLQFSKSKVVKITSGPREGADFLIGQYYHRAATTRYFEEKSSKGEVVEQPPFLLRLTNEQNQMLDELDKYWYYPSHERRELIAQEKQARRQARKANLEM